MLALSAETLSALGAPDYRIELGHAGLFHSLAQELDAVPEEVEELRERKLASEQVGDDRVALFGCDPDHGIEPRVGASRESRDAGAREAI
jgi:hypothetical protein